MGTCGLYAKQSLSHGHRLSPHLYSCRRCLRGAGSGAALRSSSSAGAGGVCGAAGGPAPRRRRQGLHEALYDRQAGLQRRSDAAAQVLHKVCGACVGDARLQDDIDWRSDRKSEYMWLKKGKILPVAVLQQNATRQAPLLMADFSASALVQRGALICDCAASSPMMGRLELLTRSLAPKDTRSSAGMSRQRIHHQTLPAAAWRARREWAGWCSNALPLSSDEGIKQETWNRKGGHEAASPVAAWRARGRWAGWCC